MPQLIKLIVSAFQGAKYVHDNITIINQQPPRVYCALMMVRQNPFPLQALLNFIIDGTELSFGITSADNKVIGKTTYLARIQQHNVTGLLITGSFYGFAGYFYRFQASNLQPNLS
jgi:hypothetical protein